MKWFLVTALVSTTALSACATYEDAVAVAKVRCDVHIGYEIDRSENERLATLGCYERQAGQVLAAQTAKVNTATAVVTAGVILSNAQ